MSTRVELDLRPGQEDVGDACAQRRRRDVADLVDGVVVVAGLALVELAHEAAEELHGLDEVGFLAPLALLRQDRPARGRHPLGVVVEGVVVPGVLLPELEGGRELRLDPAPLGPVPVVAKRDRHQEVRPGPVLGAAGDRAGVLQDLLGDVVIPAPPLVPTPLRLGHTPDHAEVAAAGDLEVVVAGPEVQGLLVVLPAPPPVLRAAAVPPEVPERFVHLGLHAFVLVGFLEPLHERLQPAAGRVEDRVVVRPRARLRSPPGIGNAELDPDGLLGSDRCAALDQRGSLLVEPQCAGVGLLLVEHLRLLERAGNGRVGVRGAVREGRGNA
jgi:hypothetical protein